MSGAGNDFVVFDNREGRFSQDLSALVRDLCDRRQSIGADGVIFLEKSRRANVRVVYHNADGGRADFCANGTRCAARFAFVKVIAGAKMTLETDWGVVGAEVEGDNVALALPDVPDLPRELTLEADGRSYPGYFLAVGVPHFVTFVNHLSIMDVEAPGRALRSSAELAPGGANVHFVEPISEFEAAIRSYERGVEAETLACGSGVVAAAIVALRLGRLRPPAVLHTRSGAPLEVSADILEKGQTAIRLRGEARIVFRGQLTPESRPPRRSR